MPRRISPPLLALWALLGAALEARDPYAGRPIMRPYGAPEIHSQGPVRSFAETGDGIVLIGSNHLVAFDGLSWRRIDVPGAYAFRALAASPSVSQNSGPGGRVWVGAEGAIGYVERDALGEWNFVSLLPRLRAAGLEEPGEIWFVSPLGRGAVFLSGQFALRWDGDRFEFWHFKADSRLRAAADPGKSVLIYQQGVGILELGGSGPPRLVCPARALPSEPLEWMLRLPSGDMLVGAAGGVYRSAGAVPASAAVGGRWVSLGNLSAPLKDQEPEAAVALDMGAVAIGTLKNGVVIAAGDGTVTEIANHASGLPDDTVYGLWSDRRGALWVGLDDGCVRIESAGSVSIFDTRDGLERGLPRRVAGFGGAAYVLTDKALYRVAEGAGSARLEPVIAYHSLLNDCIADRGGLWVGGAGGVWRVTRSGVEQAYATPGDVSRLATAPWLPGGLLFTEGRSLRAVVPAAKGGWTSSDLESGFNGVPLSLVVDGRGEMWISTAVDGVHRLKAAPDGRSPAPPVAEISRYWEGSGLPPGAAHPVLFRMGSRLFASTDAGVLVFDEARGFVAEPAFAGWSVLDAADAGTAPPEHAAYWLAQHPELADSPPFDILRVAAPEGSRGPLRWEPVRVTGIDSLGEMTSLDVLDGPKGKVGWAGGKGGLIRFKADRLAPVVVNRDLQLREVRADGAALELSPAKRISVGPGLKLIQFRYSAAQPMEASPVGVFYQTRLQGVETDWRPPDRQTFRDFTGLPPGEYVFLVRRVDRYGRPGEPARYPFAVVAPWYLRGPVIAGYLLVLALGAFAIFRRRLRRLRRQTERLDRLVAQRTRELELSSTAKSEFLENISHEIRNPLNGIVGLVNLLKPDRLAPEDRDIARSLQSTAEHLRRVSEDVLGLSKLEFGYGAVEEKPFALRRALREVAAFHEADARRGGNALSLSLPPGDDDGFVGDEAKIRTIVGNFVDNAIKYAPGTGIEIRADWGDEGGGEAQVFIAVTDGGRGVPADEQELIFQKFVRGSNAKRDAVTGSGIGLAACRTLAQRMGGSVGVESPAGHTGAGASFHLWLPLRRGKVARGVFPDCDQKGGDGSRGRDGSPSRPQTGEQSQERTALIVDDEDYNRTVLAGLARELGYRTRQAADSDAAVAAMKEQPADVVFIDFELRGSKGSETARLLRSLPGGDRAILVASTAHDSDEIRRRCREAGMDGFLLKPFDGAEVRRLIAEVRTRRASSPDGAGRSRWRSLELYARGSGESPAEAARRYAAALDGEIAAARAAAADGDAAQARAAGHRLRTLGSLVGDEALAGIALRLEERAPALGRAELAALVEEAAREAARLKTEFGSETAVGSA